ncbi:hypothetical protein, partial [Klebsiella pneumoniae]|uniref:hypothetical protein n=1 Tax=Klebsiella pneumoniae TaxID=573 RepID=UPI00284E5EBE
FLPDALSAAATASSRNFFSAGVKFVSLAITFSSQNKSAQSARHSRNDEAPATVKGSQKR